MENTQMKIAPLAGKGEEDKPRPYSNSAAAQRQRLLDALRHRHTVSTIFARRDLDIMMPAARIHELRHRFGYQIDKVWIKQPTDCGKLHRVALYVLRSGGVRND